MKDYEWIQKQYCTIQMDSYLSSNKLAIVVVRTKFGITNKYLIVVATPDAFLLIVWCIVA